MESTIGKVYSFNTENADKTIKIKEEVVDFIVQEVINDMKCTISPIIDLEKLSEAEKLFSEPPTGELSKEERKKLYETANYHPFKRMYTENGKMLIENKSTDIFVFTLLKYNFSDMGCQKLLAKRLNVSQSCVQTGGIKDRRGVTLQEVSVNCSFEQLFNYAISLSKNEKLKFKNLGYCTEFEEINNKAIDLFKNYMEVAISEVSDDIGIYNIRRGNSKKLGDLQGNYFTIKIRNFFDDFKPPTKFYNYFGPQRFGINRNNHIIGEMILNQQYDKAIELILDDHTGVEAKKSFVVRNITRMLNSKNNPKYIIESLPRHPMMLYLHAYQSHLFNLSINSRIENNKPDIECDKVMKNNELVNATENDELENIYLPLEKKNHKFLKGDMRKMIQTIQDFEKTVDEEGTTVKFFLAKSGYATMALREIAGTVIEQGFNDEI